MIVVPFLVLFLKNSVPLLLFVGLSFYDKNNLSSLKHHFLIRFYRNFRMVLCKC
ncbi:hypothetical protein C1645_792732 [Glomus cerebriforme]|uniref:Uncharacterized protein n=1 Tax=Glomus cerebriforme TaxID=658196 RepID=A0A397S7Q3_9GLOM|nr:hypothetical protein C1645_792732 [Glomus cerebriforme]